MAKPLPRLERNQLLQQIPVASFPGSKYRTLKNKVEISYAFFEVSSSSETRFLKAEIRNVWNDKLSGLQVIRRKEEISNIGTSVQIRRDEVYSTVENSKTWLPVKRNIRIIHYLYHAVRQRSERADWRGKAWRKWEKKPASWQLVATYSVCIFPSGFGLGKKFRKKH